MQGRGDGWRKAMIAPAIGGPHDAPAQEARRLVVNLLGDFLADAAPCFGAWP